jgi:hypothetical protein
MKITKTRLREIIAEEMSEGSYGSTAYDRDEAAIAGKDEKAPQPVPWSQDIGWSKNLWDISEELQHMIRTRYQIDNDDITEVALEQPPDSDNYMIRVQWVAEDDVIDASELAEIVRNEVREILAAAKK